MTEKKEIPMTDERYRIAGTNAFSFSRWSRENIPKDPHKHKVGDTVLVTIEVEIEALQYDCDGTALYRLSKVGGGYPEESISELPDDYEG